MPNEFNDARYIKLGRGGCWNDVSLGQNELHFGFDDVPHDLAQKADPAGIVAYQCLHGRSRSAATQDAREIVDFYTLPEDCLWITFARDHLWWTFADASVVWLGGDGNLHGQRMRRCRSAWSNLDAKGEPLTVQRLSTYLTRISGYRRTICRLESIHDYLSRLLNAAVDPLILRAEAAKDNLVQILNEAIGRLHQNDFETLVDIIFARSGWHRISGLGGTQEFIDMALEQPVTGERAAVQVKSHADQAALDEYIEKFSQAGSYNKLFFVKHSGPPVRTDRSDIHVWQGLALAKMVEKLGLTDWVLTRVT